MSPNSEIDTLVSIAKRYAQKAAHHTERAEHYAGLQKGIEAVIAAENADTVPAEATDTETTRNSQPDGTFKSLKKKEAATRILVAEEMSASDLFEEMKRRGHPVKTKGSLVSMLSSEKRLFVHRDTGVWGLREPELSMNGNAHQPKFLIKN